MDDVFFSHTNIINNENYNNLGNNNDRLELRENPFKNALKNAEDKLKLLIKNSDNYKDSNIIKKVLDENINVIPIFKKSKYFNYITNDITEKKSDEKNINTKSNDNLTVKSLNIHNNKEKNNNINNQYNNKTNINSERYIYHSNEVKTGLYGPNINVQNIIVKLPQNLENITSRINTQNNMNDNNLLLNINSNINLNSNTKQFIGNKRNLDRNVEKTEKENIYDEIKKLFNNIKNKSKELPENKILENKNDFFNKNETIIMESKPFCIIYLFRSVIQKIFLVNDKSIISDDQGIIEILNKIKNDIINKLKEKK